MSLLWPQHAARDAAPLTALVMFLGHFGLAFATRRVAPRPSLGWLFAASQLPDLVWPVLVLAGVERVRIEPGATAFTPLVFEHYPWSHSLVATVVWGAVAGGLYFALRRDRTGALAIAALVVSHWILDWITHAPDLPLYPGSDLHAGLGLWNSVAGTLAVELPLFLIGAAIYARATTPARARGRWGFMALVVFLLLVHAGNAFGPPPPNVTAIAVAGLSLWLLVLWAWWVDSNRLRAHL